MVCVPARAASGAGFGGRRRQTSQSRSAVPTGAESGAMSGRRGIRASCRLTRRGRRPCRCGLCCRPGRDPCDRGRLGRCRSRRGHGFVLAREVVVRARGPERGRARSAARRPAVAAASVVGAVVVGGSGAGSGERARAPGREQAGRASSGGSCRRRWVTSAGAAGGCAGGFAAGAAIGRTIGRGGDERAAARRDVRWAAAVERPRGGAEPAPESPRSRSTGRRCGAG